LESVREVGNFGASSRRQTTIPAKRSGATKSAGLDEAPSAALAMKPQRSTQTRIVVMVLTTLVAPHGRWAAVVELSNTERIGSLDFFHWQQRSRHAASACPAASIVMKALVAKMDRYFIYRLLLHMMSNSQKPVNN
jgi:hypothetical protein